MDGVCQGVLSLLHSRVVPEVSGRSVVQKLVDLCLAEFRRKSGCDARESRRAMTKVRRGGRQRRAHRQGSALGRGGKGLHASTKEEVQQGPVCCGSGG